MDSQAVSDDFGVVQIPGDGQQRKINVLVVSREVPRWRSVVEGDTARDVRRRIGRKVVVEGITV